MEALLDSLLCSKDFCTTTFLNKYATRMHWKEKSVVQLNTPCRQLENKVRCCCCWCCFHSCRNWNSVPSPTLSRRGGQIWAFRLRIQKPKPAPLHLRCSFPANVVSTRPRLAFLLLVLKNCTQKQLVLVHFI